MMKRRRMNKRRSGIAESSGARRRDEATTKAQTLERRCGCRASDGAPERQLRHNPRRHIHRRQFLKQ